MKTKTKILITLGALLFLFLVAVVTNSGRHTPVDENGNPVTIQEVQQ